MVSLYFRTRWHKRCSPALLPEAAICWWFAEQKGTALVSNFIHHPSTAWNRKLVYKLTYIYEIQHPNIRCITSATDAPYLKINMKPITILLCVQHDFSLRNIDNWRADVKLSIQNDLFILFFYLRPKAASFLYTVPVILSTDRLTALKCTAFSRCQ